MKYELLEREEETGLCRIRALRDIPRHGVKAGDIGGRIESEANLNQHAEAYVHGDAWVSGNARVYGNARVSGNACVHGEARVYGNAWVSGNARVSGNACVHGEAQVSGEAYVHGDAWVSGGSLLAGEVGGTPNVISIAAQTGLAIVNGIVYAYKRVHSDLTSGHDMDFQYVVGEYAEAEANLDPAISCGPGLHVAPALYWSTGERLLLCEVRLEDVVACQEGKLRVKRLKVLDDVTEQFKGETNDT